MVVLSRIPVKNYLKFYLSLPKTLEFCVWLPKILYISSKHFYATHQDSAIHLLKTNKVFRYCINETHNFFQFLIFWYIKAIIRAICI